MIRAAAVCSVLVLLGLVPTTPREIACTFHHVHVRVPEPAAAITATNAKLQGVRRLLRGNGAGVRAGGQYGIVDRDEGPDPPDVDRYQSASYPASIYRQASQWLSARGITIDPAEFSGTAIAAGVPPFRIDAIAFSVSDLDAAVDWLRARGETPATRSDDTAQY